MGRKVRSFIKRDTAHVDYAIFMNFNFNELDMIRHVVVHFLSSRSHGFDQGQMNNTHC